MVLLYRQSRPSTQPVFFNKSICDPKCVLPNLNFIQPKNYGKSAKNVIRISINYLNYLN